MAAPAFPSTAKAPGERPAVIHRTLALFSLPAVS